MHSHMVTSPAARAVTFRASRQTASAIAAMPRTRIRGAFIYGVRGDSGNPTGSEFKPAQRKGRHDRLAALPPQAHAVRSHARRTSTEHLNNRSFRGDNQSRLCFITAAAEMAVENQRLTVSQEDRIRSFDVVLLGPQQEKSPPHQPISRRGEKLDIALEPNNLRMPQQLDSLRQFATAHFNIGRWLELIRFQRNWRTVRGQPINLVGSSRFSTPGQRRASTQHQNRHHDSERFFYMLNHPSLTAFQQRLDRSPNRRCSDQLSLIPLTQPR